MARRKQSSSAALGIGLGVAMVPLLLLFATSASAAPAKKTLAPTGGAPNPTPDSSWNPKDWTGALPLPKADDVQGSVAENWGITPDELRPLFLLTEQVSGIRGSARVLSIIARRESRWISTAHNDSKKEVTASTNAYNNLKAKRAPLKYGAKAAGFGSGGLFGLLAPYYLWTGINEVKDKAPLLAAEPETMFFPRLAAFAGIAYMQRLLANYDVRDVPEIKVGWASVSLLDDDSRGGDTYMGVRGRFAEDVQASGINLDHPTIPSIEIMRADAKSKWPGVLSVFQSLVGKVPRRVLNA
jgi:hypothetical protein